MKSQGRTIWSCFLFNKFSQSFRQRSEVFFARFVSEDSQGVWAQEGPQGWWVQKFGVFIVRTILFYLYIPFLPVFFFFFFLNCGALYGTQGSVHASKHSATALCPQAPPVNLLQYLMYIISSITHSHVVYHSMSWLQHTLPFQHLLGLAMCPLWVRETTVSRKVLAFPIASGFQSSR